jgi:hypothetical protein
MREARVPEVETEIFEEERVNEPVAAERVNRLAEARPRLARVREVKETAPGVGRRRKQYEEVKLVISSCSNSTVERVSEPSDI